MSNVLSSLIRPAKALRISPSGLEATASTLSSRNHVSEELDLRDLNASLQTLTNIFPDVQPEVFREMLSTFSAESRLQVITEALLKHSHKYVKGRFRTPAEGEEQRETAQKYKYRKEDQVKDTRGIPLATEDTFRSQAYRDAARDALCREFQSLNHSTIEAVLAEYNWSYTQARPTLLALSSKSWRSSVTNFLMRRRAPNAKRHPLVLWTAADPRINRPRLPLLVETKSDELNKELYESLIAPEMERLRRAQMQEDLELAIHFNEEEAEREGEMYDCECCFVPSTLQEMSACDVDGHYICFRCIRHAINAALYDQGWARNINNELCTLKCIAPMPDGCESCKGCVPPRLVERALLEEQEGEDTLNKLNERFANEALMKSQLALARCPFCSYAEANDPAYSDASLLVNLFANLLSAFRVEPRSFVLASLASVSVLRLSCYKVMQVFIGIAILLYVLVAFLFRVPIMTALHAALRRAHLKRRGLRFRCMSPACARSSCLACKLPWHDPHTCFSSQLTSLRLTLERATTDAVKRTCPRCNLSFVKSEGCNKLVCLCGYSMCYICRQGLAQEGYQHFCGHFRERPGQSCTECNKCDLYKVEDEEKAMRRAQEIAEKEWWTRQGEGAKEGLREEVSKDYAVLGIKRRSWESWIGGILDSFLV